MVAIGLEFFHTRLFQTSSKGEVVSSVIDGIDYGPLACLVGTWEGDSGMDVAPEPDGDAHSPYYETIIFEAAGDVDNAETQDLVIVRYHQVVKRKSNDKVFHNESGYYTWEAEAGVVTQSFVIPRGVGVVAGGSAEQTENGATIKVAAALDSNDYSIVQAPFMRDNASTQSFTHSITVEGDQLSYEETTVVDIYGKVFNHTDQNTLTRKSS